MKNFSLRAIGVIAILHLCVAMTSAQDNAPAKAPARLSLRNALAAQVEKFDNQGKPLIETLLRIADKFHLPMGVEKVERQSLEEPIQVQFQSGTVSQLLNFCLKKSSGYRWTQDSGAILISGTVKDIPPDSLFNFTIPEFKANHIDLDQASDRLGITLIFLKEKPSGLASSYLGDAKLSDVFISLEMRNATVRHILNRLVAAHGKAVWIARVPLKQTNKRPSAGLWKVLSHGVYDPRGLLDIPPSRP
jgi:hypothetical protein